MSNVFNGVNQMVKDKKRYRQFLRDVKALPPAYAETLLALQAYLWNFARSGGIIVPLEEMLRMFQESAAEQVPVAQLVGGDPVAFADNIMAQYPDELWLIKYQNRLRAAVKEAEQHERD
ncbi:DUF1048 domain-containing protein [Lacticaseibacillus kribbianus]|uniref:DUF1048 domain-containing protein n=1 Tax=Lacticaseibacillus kribbianus TaxID=2926292 RepID=UPI001CD25CB8|nr:DUF1048 domain-containing protein [Lacticaseibacillus kribbianus]